MDIVIKSFNRPFYLDRCLKSIHTFVQGTYNIIVLDDGTSAKYLAKIQADYPGIKIFKSPRYHAKVQAIEDHITGKKHYDQYDIPVQFWIEQISQCSDVFLLLEDDIWLKAPLDIHANQELITRENIVTLKLSWLGNNNTIQGHIKKLNDEVETIEPLLPFSSAFLGIVLLKNFLGIKSILIRLGFLKWDFYLKYYSLYNVASAFFKREYWLYLWKHSHAKVNEFYQLQNALKWLLKNNQSKYGKTSKEVTATSFTTSATNSFEGIHLDVIRLNNHLNDAWLNGEMNSMENFPNDFSQLYYKSIIEKVSDPNYSYTEWLKWVRKFKKQYKDVGCTVDD